MEWDAEIVNEIENEVIGWRSLAGSDIATAGSVRFSTARAGAQHPGVGEPAVRARRGGAPAACSRSLLGRDPAHIIREDLRRFKQLLEAGEIPRATRGADA